MRKRQGTDYWRDQVEAWRQSGLSQIAYCVRHDVNIKSFRRWRIKLQQDAAAPALTLVPVSVTTPQPEPIIRLHSPGGWRIELATANPAWLADLLRQLP
jgi:transposase-like protein